MHNYPAKGEPFVGLPSSSSGLQEPAVMTLQSKCVTGLIPRWAVVATMLRGKATTSLNTSIIKLFLLKGFGLLTTHFG